LAPLRIARLPGNFFVREDQVVDDGANAARVHGAGQVARGASDLGDVELLVQAFVTADLQLVGLDLNDVPVVVATLDLGAQHTETAVPRFVDQPGAGGVERLEENFLLAVLVGAAPRHDGQVALGVRGAAGQGKCRSRGEGGEQAPLHRRLLG